jgi:acyl-CoA thioesterase-1
LLLIVANKGLNQVFWKVKKIIVVSIYILVCSVILSDECDAQRSTILFLGNSLSAGYGLEPSQAFPSLIQQKIDTLGWKFKVVNAGLSGDTSAGGLRRLQWLFRQSLDVLVLELGGNDGLRGIPLDETRKNLQSIIDKTKLKYPKAKILIAGMKVPPNMGERYSRKFQTLFTELAKNNKTELIPFLLKGVGGIAELNLSDRIHPTIEGHKIVAENVWKELKPILVDLNELKSEKTSEKK